MKKNKRKVILDLAVTLDGFIEGPNGEIDWCVMDGESNFIDFLKEIDAIFYGRISYDLWGNYEPDDEASIMTKQICNEINSKKKYVFSRTKTKDNKGNASFITENVTDWVRRMKATPGKDIWLYGGAKLITTFINEGLVDVLRLAVHPIILGAGKPLFHNITKKVPLHLDQILTSQSGVILMKYSIDN